MSVGDVTSAERGSDARYNDGKPDMALIPVRLIADTYAGKSYAEALRFIGLFQETHDVEQLLLALDTCRDLWPDCARVFEYGKQKYAAWNWAKGMDWSIPIACAARHFIAWVRGEDNDPESGLPHMGHFMCNLVMLRVFAESYPEGNDLPPSAYFKQLL